MSRGSEMSKRGAAGMAAATLGRARTFDDRKAEGKRARFGGRECRALLREAEAMRDGLRRKGWGKGQFAEGLGKMLGVKP